MRRLYMSAQIKISYTDDKELQYVLCRLAPVIKKQKVAKNQVGKHKNAYIYLK